MTLPPDKPLNKSVRNQKQCKLLVYGNPNFVTSVLCENCAHHDDTPKTSQQHIHNEEDEGQRIDETIDGLHEEYPNEGPESGRYEHTDDESVDSLVTRTLLRLTSKLKGDHDPLELEPRYVSNERNIESDTVPEKTLADLSRLLRTSRPLRSSFASKIQVTENVNTNTNEGWLRVRVKTLKEFFENLNLSRKSTLADRNNKPKGERASNSDKKFLDSRKSECVVSIETKNNNPNKCDLQSHYETAVEVPYEVDNFKVIFKKPCRPPRVKESQEDDKWGTFYGCEINHTEDVPYIIPSQYNNSKIFINTHDLSTFTLDTKRMEEIHLKTKNAKMCRCALRFLVVILALGVFVASIIGLSLYCTRGSRFFGAL